MSAITLTSSFNYLQSMDNAYRIRGWKTGINYVTSCSLQSGDQLQNMFKLQLSYDSPVGGGTAQYNGNISTMQWGTYINSTCLPQQQYRLSYDAADRITAADHWTNSSSWVNTNNYSESNITYDLNGNIRTYTRRGLTVAPSTYGIIDQLTYSYGDAVRPDLLTDVQDAGSLTKGFVDNASSGTNYLYDANGNLTQDIHKTMVFTYNHRNLPNSMVKDGISNVTWTYTADGEKLTKVGPGGTRNYISGIEYLGANTDVIYHAQGRCMANGSSWYYDYTLRDHLGDARVNFRANGTAVTYLEDFHYYPFGMAMEGLGTILSTGNDYRYNGKELNEDYSLNWYDYGKRWYDPSICRFPSVDPIIEKFPYLTPYNYASNDPIRKIDLHGMQGVKYTEIQNGREIIKVESDVYIAIGRNGYSERQVEKIGKSLNRNYDMKVEGQRVDFNFNVHTFNSDMITLEDKASELRKTSIVETASQHELIPGEVRRSITGFAIGKKDLPEGTQGVTKTNAISISTNVDDLLHTASHEAGHFLLLGSKNQPATREEHDRAGGIFRYGVKDPSGAVIESTLGVSRNNVKTILSNVPNKKM